MTAFANAAGAGLYLTQATRIQHTYERLSWLYGSARALAIVRGEDPQANADIAAWRDFGKWGQA